MNTPARCIHFGECGGCKTQDVPYPQQVREKEAMLGELFAPFHPGPVPVAPSPQVWHYRNKVDPAFARKRYDEKPPDDFDRETVIGFKKRGRWFWPLDIQACHIAPEGLGALLEAVRAWYRREGLQAFDDRKDAGILRALLVREGKQSGERMVVLITRDGTFDKAGFVALCRETFGADSVYRGIYRGLADVAEAEELELLWGKATIDERLYVHGDGGVRELVFRISPMSFFQTNTLAAQQLYSMIRAWAKQTGGGMLYDLYGGAGGIALSCADLFGHVWSVENVAEASADGRVNAQRNEIANVTFITEKVKNYLRYMILDNEGFPEHSAAVVDPPRAGLHPKALKRLIALRPAYLLYVSCNPKLLAQEMPQLLKQYQLTDLRAIDMFPHTPHVEVLASFIPAG